MSKIKEGQQVEYHSGPVSWQDDGSWVSIDRQWSSGKVLAFSEHPLPIDTPDAKPDVVVSIQPDDGQPQFDLNAKLIRT